MSVKSNQPQVDKKDEITKERCVRPLTNYPVCLGQTTVRILLPRDLTLKEAGRIYGVMKTLCVDFGK